MGFYKIWSNGDLSTTLILADHSENRTYDLGFDEYKSLRSIFHVTFFKTSKNYRVRYIGEVSNSEVLQNMNYSLELFMGHQQAKSIYKKENVTQIAGSRWTKVFYKDPIYGKVNVDHHLKYLTSTQAIPNFDTSIRIDESVIQCEYESCYYAWGKRPKDIFDNGRWQKAMPTAGGRSDIGMFPKWTMLWLYTGDYRMKEFAFYDG